MAQITLKGKTIHTIGELPATGTVAPDFVLTNGELQDVSLADFAGQRKLLSIVPSLDTGLCAISAERFNAAVADQENLVMLNISADLPFAAGRICECKSLDRVTTLSTFRSPSFGTDYGVQITDGPMAGLCSRAVLVLDTDNTVLHAEQVPEITQEPDYAAALAALA